MTLSVDLKILDPRIGSLWQMPNYQTPYSAGLDLIACLDEPLTLMPNDSTLISSGLAMHLANPNYCAMIVPRSGLGHKHGIVMGNLTGLIDADYQGPLFISCWNRSAQAYTIEPGDRIAQMIVVPVVQPTWNIVDAFSLATERAQGGFGSTGKSASKASS